MLLWSAAAVRGVRLIVTTSRCSLLLSYPTTRLVLAVAAEVRHDVEVSSVLDPAFPGWQWQPDEIRRLAGRAARPGC